MKRALFATLCACATLVVGAGQAGASTPAVAVYNSTETPLPGNVLSEGPEAYAFSELGDSIDLAGTARTLTAVTVTMSSFACQFGAWNTGNCASPVSSTKYSVPITLNVYAAASPQMDGTVRPGALLTTATKTFAIPYRPSADLKHCNQSNNSLGKWYDKKSTTCFNGKAVNIAFNFQSLKLHLPNTVVLGVAYNTTHHGYNPIGESAACYTADGGCAYDSLNIGLNADPAAPTTGAQTYPGTAFETLEPGSPDRCDSTPVDGVFNQNSPTSSCWTGYVPEFKVTAH